MTPEEARELKVGDTIQREGGKPLRVIAVVVTHIEVQSSSSARQTPLSYESLKEFSKTRFTKFVEGRKRGRPRSKQP